MHIVSLMEPSRGRVGRTVCRFECLHTFDEALSTFVCQNQIATELDLDDGEYRDLSSLSMKQNHQYLAEYISMLVV